jgi:hypothetical protein
MTDYGISAVLLLTRLGFDRRKRISEIFVCIATTPGPNPTIDSIHRRHRKNDVEARAEICGGLSWLGVSLDEARNRYANNPTSISGSPCSVQVLPSQEDEQIAHHTRALFPWGVSA